MTLELYVTSQGRLRVENSPGDCAELLGAVASRKIERAFSAGEGAGLLHLATVEGKAALPLSLAFARCFAHRYFTQLCHLTESEHPSDTMLAAPPEDKELERIALEAPPLKGLEYLSAAALKQAWIELDSCVRADIAACGRDLRAYLHDKNPDWQLVGRITFRLAENKRDEDYPFAFLATYASGISERGESSHVPLARALQEYAGAANRKRLVALLTPIHAVSENLEWVRALVESGDIYQALAWTPAEAYRFLKDIPAMESAGLAVRIPNWWRAARPPRPQVSVRVGEGRRTALGVDALLDFSVDLSLDGQPLTEEERKTLLSSATGLVRLRGQWIEADGEKLAAALTHWKRVEKSARSGEISFHEGMRLLAGVAEGSDKVGAAVAPREWSGVEAGQWLQDVLARLRDPAQEAVSLQGLQAALRPYQLTGVKWLTLLNRLGLGACLADDMGLGKTIQVVALLLQLRAQKASTGRTAAGGARRATFREAAAPSLIVAPASLIANWKAEIQRFAPSLSVFVAHSSESRVDIADEHELDGALAGIDVVITTYGVVMRTEALRRRRWRIVVLDEAQAIKNPGAQQTRAVKQLQADGRVALTGTPVENRLGDLWSLFDFLNPGLLGSAQEFGRVTKRLAQDADRSYAPLRQLVQPYILRRMKTDKRVIADLPEKTEVRAFCGLTREQARLYEQCVRDLAQALARSGGIQRRGLVLAHLMQLKQICNHPAQWQGQGDFTHSRSGKFGRLSELCEELAERQQRVLVFTQFREMVPPLVQHLTRVFDRPGLALDGSTAVGRRRALVDDFQREDGPPFFVLSLKAGGTGLNLTGASHVIHFDRWWNPAVENQATDRAFRIGQRRNVVVHKFVCRGTVEEKIDSLIESKSDLSRNLLDNEAGQLLTEMSDADLLSTVALDIHKACDA
ncbi:MAG TPA: DEAD/DEAH box helicase [Steroidobacter sp.]|nr:DEAD/DEAH box helicase [Steroidobacter sp.]